ncbi:MAG: pyrophosphate synthase [Deltaproteobacteria bacterium]|nr:pyrophosphate synthase [Deltaproteobacteria bacterium]
MADAVLNGKLPNHLAIIMDGNGRWAQARMLPRIMGHRKGVQTVRLIVEECTKVGIRFLTLFAFSAENWSRPKTEVRSLMSLLKKYIRLEVPRMMRNNTRFRVIGNRDDLPEDVRIALDDAMAVTAGNSGMTLTLALSYGSRQEILQAAKAVAADIVNGRLLPAELTENSFSDYLYTAALPDPDLLIRTSGEMRISNFMLWQLAYAELYFTEVNWPDFGREELHKALNDYRLRERRFGLTSDQLRSVISG